MQLYMYAALYSRTPSAWHWAGPGRCQLARGSSWGMICPLCDMWCRFSPWKSDFHNISTSVTHKHRNYPQQTRNSFEKYLTAEGDLWIEGCDIKAQVHWHCSKVDSGQGLAGRVVVVAPTWSLSLSMVIEVDWQHCQEDTANPKSAKSSQESWKKSWLLLLSQYHEWLTFSFCSFHWFNNCELKSTQVQEWSDYKWLWLLYRYTIIWLKPLKIKTSVNKLSIEWNKPLVISSDWRKMESQDYEHHRNLTLMFFFEKLLEKGGKCFFLYIFLVQILFLSRSSGSFPN